MTYNKPPTKADIEKKNVDLLRQLSEMREEITKLKEKTKLLENADVKVKDNKKPLKLPTAADAINTDTLKAKLKYSGHPPEVQAAIMEKINISRNE